MKVKIKDEEYPLLIERKKTTKNLYIRVKEDLSIYLTCHTSVKDQEIITIVDQNLEKIETMIVKMKQKLAYQNEFYFLGHRYDIVYTEFCDITFGQDKVFISKTFDLEKWKRKQALKLFKEHLETCYQAFKRPIPAPTLRLRKMKSRWGVCNIKTHVITLNTELINKEIGCLDYVIYHELSHLVEPNHSKKFWAIVEEHCPDYRYYRKLTNTCGEETV